MYDYNSLKKIIKIRADHVECPVLDNGIHFVKRRRSDKKLNSPEFLCSKHKHPIYISPSTFEYINAEDNLLWKDGDDRKLLSAIEKAKRESRMARERSEDAVTWNVFRFFEKHSLLVRYLNMTTGEENHDPKLIYWSYDQEEGNTYQPLFDARNAFSENEGRGSEPDLIVETSKNLFFIEAKFGSGNSSKPSGPDKLDKYVHGADGWFSKAFIPGSNAHQIAVKSKLYELMRLWLLGSWAARKLGKEFYLINIVVEHSEKDISDRFKPHLKDANGGVGSFKRQTWEDIYRFILSEAPDDDIRETMARYFEGKTLGYTNTGKLRKAFSI